MSFLRLCLSRRLVQLLSVVTLTIGGWFSSFAHDPGLSSLQVQAQSNSWRAILTYNRSEIQSLIESRQTTPAAVQSNDFARIASTCLHVSQSGQQIQPNRLDIVIDNENNVEFTYTFTTFDPEITINSRLLADLVPSHRQIYSFTTSDGVLREQKLLSHTRSEVTLNLSVAGGAMPGSRSGESGNSLSFTEFFVSGVKHILIGFDHLLFLFGLLVVCKKVMEVVKVVTLFTLAHSLTLALATLGLVRLDPSIVEPLIAATIIYVGCENFFGDKAIRWRGWLTFAFGLVHGLGFAGVLAEHGVTGKSLLVPLLSFNLGVEVGQLCVAAVGVPLIFWLRQKPRISRYWIPVTSSAVIAMGGFWLIQRLFFS